MQLPGLVARAYFRWRLWRQTPRRTNLEGAPSRGLRHGHVGSDDEIEFLTRLGAG